MEGVNITTGTQEKYYDPFLEDLWKEYGFRSRPPFADSAAEKRLKETCDKYANFIDHHKNELPSDRALIYGTKKISSSDTARRELHNKIAIMVIGKQRSGMNEGLARHVADFAYEYSRGYKIEEEDKYKS